MIDDKRHTWEQPSHIRVSSISETRHHSHVKRDSIRQHFRMFPQVLSFTFSSFVYCWSRDPPHFNDSPVVSSHRILYLTQWFVIDGVRHTCEQLSHIWDSDPCNEKIPRITFLKRDICNRQPMDVHPVHLHVQHITHASSLDKDAPRTTLTN